MKVEGNNMSRKSTGPGYNPYRKANGEFATKAEAGMAAELAYNEALELGDEANIASIEDGIINHMPNTALGQKILEKREGLLAGGMPKEIEYEASSRGIKQFLKDQGVDTRKLSVTSDSWFGGQSFRVVIKDLSVDIKQVSNLVLPKFRNVRVDEHTGEILEGGNTYVNIEYDFETITEALEERTQEIKSVYDKDSITDEVVLRENDNFIVSVNNSFAYAYIKPKYKIEDIVDPEAVISLNEALENNKSHNGKVALADSGEYYYLKYESGSLTHSLLGTKDRIIPTGHSRELFKAKDLKQGDYLWIVSNDEAKNFTDEDVDNYARRFAGELLEVDFNKYEVKL